MARSRQHTAASTPSGGRRSSRCGSRVRRAVTTVVVGSLAIAAVVFAQVATADTAPTATVGKISYTSHYWPDVVTSESGMATAWESASAATAQGGYCNAGVTPVTLDGLSNNSLCGTTSNIISHVTVPFTTTAAGSWRFQIAPDYGNGSELLVDGTVVQSRWYDIYAGGDYGNTSQLFDYTADLPAGQHTIEIYGAEPCCDGAWSARFQLVDAPAWAPLQTSPPQVNVTGLPADNTVEYGSPDPGCNVTDVFDGTDTPSATLSAVSGPRASAGIGSRTATCTYTDSRGLAGTASATYSIVDTTAPVLADVPVDQTAAATSGSGASVSWPAPTATDTVDGTVPVSCAPASGTTFAVGLTTVTCSATDLSDNTSTATFTVTVHANATTTTLQIAPATVPVGGTTTLTATVTSATGSPTGTVTFIDESDSRTLGEAALVDGTATLTVPVGTTVGSRNVVAAFAGSDVWAASISQTAPLRVIAAAPPSSSAPAPTTPAAGPTVAPDSSSSESSSSGSATSLADTGWGDSATATALGLLMITAGGLLLLLNRRRVVRHH